MKITYLGFKELIERWRAVFSMGLTISLPIMIFLVINAYQTGLEIQFSKLHENFLLAQEAGSMGELYGSRLPAELRSELQNSGSSLVAAQLHTVTGTSPENAVLLRGIELENYIGVEEFQVIEGRPLQPGDLPRTAMVGIKLAEDRNVYTNGRLEIRGRDFLVVGVFANGTYADYEVWVSIKDAQALLGWGTDVSTFIIPAGERLKAGDSLPGGVAIVKKGESGENLVKEWRPFFKLFGVIASTLGVAVAMALASMLWRLAWLRRRELAILQSIGFGKLTLFWYLFVQGLGITTIGFLLGISEALVISKLIPLQATGITTEAVFNLYVILLSLGFAGLITLAGSGIPAYWFSQKNLVELMKVEG